MKKGLLLALLLGLGHAVTSSASTVVFDSMNGSRIADYYVGYWPSANFQTFLPGQQFTPTVTGYIDALTLAAWTPDKASGVTLTFGVFADNAGQIGSLLETLDVTTQGFPVNGLPTATGTYASGATLSAGTTYWLVGQTLTQAYWSTINPGQPGSFVEATQIKLGTSLVIDQPYVNYYGATAPYSTGMTISMAAPSAVPLPAAAWLFGGALGALGLVKRRAFRT